jgi:hypothetical protein
LLGTTTANAADRAETFGVESYEEPKLVRHGDIDELTQGTIITGNVGDCASTDC